MNSPIKRASIGQRSPMARRRQPGAKESSLSKEEKTYREIMGVDGKVRPQFQHLLINLEIEAEDLLDK